MLIENNKILGKEIQASAKICASINKAFEHLKLRLCWFYKYKKYHRDAQLLH